MRQSTHAPGCGTLFLRLGTTAHGCTFAISAGAGRSTAANTISTATVARRTATPAATGLRFSSLLIHFQSPLRGFLPHIDADARRVNHYSSTKTRNTFAEVAHPTASAVVLAAGFCPTSKAYPSFLLSIARFAAVANSFACRISSPGS